jgi:hypothetical protein
MLFTTRTTARKLRLFVCTRVRQDAHLIRSRQPLRAVQLGEDLADGKIGPPQLRDFVGFWNPWLLLAPDPAEGAVTVLEEKPWCDLPGGLDILAELFGTGEPLAFEPGWRTPGVLMLASVVYHDDRTPLSGRLERIGLLVLADTLLDAGCDDPAIQDHLRSRGRHVGARLPADGNPRTDLHGTSLPPFRPHRST